jgi:hypothetical protein
VGPGYCFLASIESEFRDDEVEEAALFWPDTEVEGVVPASGATRLKRRFRVDEVSGSHPAMMQQGSLARLE